MNLEKKRPAWSLKPVARALVAAGVLALPIGAWAQAVPLPFEVEGTVTEIRTAAGGSVDLKMFGQWFNVPITAHISTPSAELTTAQLADTTKFPGRDQEGFVGGTGILVGEIVDVGGVPTLAIESVEIEPAETVLIGRVSDVIGGVVYIMGVPLNELPRAEEDPTFRMPSDGFLNDFGFPILPSSVVPGSFAAAEGYYAGNEFHHFRVEVDGGTLVSTAPQSALLRVRCDQGGRLEVIGSTFAPASATVQIYNAKTNFRFGQIAAVPDPANPLFGSYRYRTDIDDDAGIVDTDGNCPSEVRADASNGTSATMATFGIIPPPPPPGTNVAPVAFNDSATTTENLVTVIDLTDNDTDLNGNLDPATVEHGPLPDGLTLTFPTPRDGTVSVTASQANTYAFTYVVKDTEGLSSAPATVTVNVLPAPAMDTLTVLRSQYRVRQDRWELRGSSNQPEVEVTITLVRTGAPIAQGFADLAGNWLFDVRGSGVVPLVGDMVRISSTGGGTVDVPVTRLQ